MSFVDRLNQLDSTFSVLEKLQKNERLYVSKKALGRQASPYPLSPSEKFFPRILEAIETFFRKGIQTLKRRCTRQSTDRQIEKIQNVAVKALQSLRAKQKITEAEVYKALDRLHSIHSRAGKAKEGLERFRRTCRSGAPWLFRPSNETRDARLVQINLVVQSVTNAGRLIEARISEMESDPKRVSVESKAIDSLLQSLFSGQPFEDRLFMKKVAQDKLSQLFGAEYTARWMEVYGFEEKGVISGKELQRVMVGFAANLRMQEVAELYRLRKDQRGLLDFRQYPSSLSRCTQEQLFDFLSQVRKKVRASFPEGSDFGEEPDQFHRDLAILELHETISEYESYPDDKVLLINHVKHLGYTEFLSRDVVYALCYSSACQFQEGTLIPLLDDQMRRQCLEAQPLYHQRGLHGVAFLPTEMRGKEPIAIQVAFRGTYDRDSVRRDLSFREREYWFGFEGPGKMSFNAAEPEMLRNLLQQLASLRHKNRNAQFSLNFMGHSLGGADAQRMIRVFAQSCRDTNAEDVQSLSLHAYNSPGIENDVCWKLADLAGELPDMQFNIRYFDTHYDWVQTMGESRVGSVKSTKEYPENMHLTIMTFSRASKLLDDLEKKLVGLGVGQWVLGTPFKGALLQLVRRLDAHTKHFFWNHDDENARVLNGTHISDIRTNHPDDKAIRYGVNLDQLPEELHLKSIRERLLGIGARIQKARRRKCRRVLTFLCLRKQKVKPHTLPPGVHVSPSL